MKLEEFGSLLLVKDTRVSKSAPTEEVGILPMGVFVWSGRGSKEEVDQ